MPLDKKIEIIKSWLYLFKNTIKYYQNTMQYQCSYSDIEKGICYFLTTNANQKFTPNEILTGLLTEKICTTLNSKYLDTSYIFEFEEKCYNASKLFSKLKKSGNYYSFSTKAPIDLEIVKAIALSPSDYPTISFDSIYAEGETILHILCANGLYEYINTISESFNINPHMKNESGQTLFDVIPNTQEGYQTFKCLFNSFLTQEVVRTESRLNAVKESNMALTKKNGELALINSEMLLTNRKLVVQNATILRDSVMIRSRAGIVSWLQTVLIAILISYILYDKFI